MVTHVVLFKLKDVEADRDEAVRRLRSLDGNVPALRSIQVGADVRHRENTFDVALITTFDNETDLANYHADPFHREVVAHMHKVAEQAITVDFES